MAVDLARVPVSSPTFTPLSFGLLSAAEIVTEGGTKWELGIDLTPNACEEAGTTVAPCPTPTSITKAPNITGVDNRGAEAFTVFAEIICNPVGFDDVEFQDRTVAALTNGEGRAVERVFWTGAAGGTTIEPHLAANAESIDARGFVMQTAATVVTGSAMNVTRAIGLLEGALSNCYGGEGVIHVPREALAHLSAATLIYRDGQRLRTQGGNIIAAYSPNLRTGPAGTNPAAANDFWFYATGAVNIRRSGVRVIGADMTAALNRSENTIVMIAERTYVINWDCCHFAQQVTFT